MKRIRVVMIICLLLVLTGCVDEKKVDALTLQLSELSGQLEMLQSDKAVSEEKVKTLSDQLLTLEKEKQDLSDISASVVLEKEDLILRVTALEEELNIQNEAAMKVLEAIKVHDDKIMTLKPESALKTIVAQYAPALKPKIAAHYANCLYQATHREGVDVLIAMIDKKSFDEIDGIIGHFADALAKTSDLSYKTQLMLEAQSLNGTQSPTTLYFYARVLFFLSRWNG